MVAALFSCYEQAGRPTLKAIEDWISAHHDLPTTVSKETVRRMLVGITVPLTWAMAGTVFVALCGMAGRDPDEPDHDERDRPTGMTRQEVFHRHWQDAVTELSSQRYDMADEDSSEPDRGGAGHRARGVW